MKNHILGRGIVLLGILWWSAATIAAEERALWRIGKADGSTAEFALAPNGYQKFREAGFYAVGRSDSRTDWPYVQPGPGDGWAGNRPHAFVILFGVRNAPSEGSCRLVLLLADTHAGSPPRLRASINGQDFERQLPQGGGDESIFGDPKKGKPSRWDIAFPARLLRAGENEIVITTRGGSWMLYDAIEFYAPASVEPAPVPDRTIISALHIAPVVKRQGDRGVQPLHLALRHLGDEADAAVSLNDSPIGNVHLRSGVQQMELGIAPVNQAATGKVRVAVGGRIVAEQDIALRPPRMKEVWLLNHSHVDIGYTHRQAEVIDIQIGNMNKAMELAIASAANPEGMRFKWNPEAI